MSGQRLLQGGIIVVVVGAILGWSFFHHPANNASHPEGTWWLCDKGHSFQMTTKQLSDWFEHHWGEGIPCPTCGSQKTVRAFKCPSCGTVYASRGAQKCPKCGAPTPQD